MPSRRGCVGRAAEARTEHGSGGWQPLGQMRWTVDIPVWLWFVVGIPGLVLAVAVLAVLWAFRRAGAPPDLDPAAFVHAGRSRGDGPVVVCLGDSITHGKASHPFVETLRQRLPDHTLINAGINGELSYNLLQRVDTVLACEPDAVAILVGTNDATASLMPMKQKKALAKKGLPAPPSVSTYRDWMRDLVTALQRGGVPRIAVLSPPSIAEDVEQPIGVGVHPLAVNVVSQCLHVGVASGGLCHDDAWGACAGANLPIGHRVFKHGGQFFFACRSGR